MLKNKINSLIIQLKSLGIDNEDVLNAIEAVPRTHFIDEALSHQAYENLSLPIGSGQTISQPYIVAKMTALLNLNKTTKVLEIGTGSGYQTAVLAKIVDHVYTIERIKKLQWKAKRKLRQLDIHNISTKHGDGSKGWHERSPFDAIIVTAAAKNVPQELLNQLANNGRLVIPTGEDNQVLNLIERKNDTFKTIIIEPVRFVPLVSGALV